MTAICRHLWCPEELAVRWRRLPERIGYTVLPVPPEFARQRWEREAAGERRRIADGWYTKERPIEDALIDSVLAQEQAAFVVADGVAFYVSAYPDYLQQHDTTDSWWLEVSNLDYHEIRSIYPDVVVDFRWELNQQVADTLFDSFLASGARVTWKALKSAYALNIPPPSRGIITKWFAAFEAKRRLFLCPADLVSQWPVMLLDLLARCEITPLHASVPSPTGETFTCGRIGNWFGEITIRSGPAFDPSTWNDAAFLAIESKGIVRRKAIFEGLTQRAVERGATLVTGSEVARPSCQ
jgi:hypothetical protein